MKLATLLCFLTAVAVAACHRPNKKSNQTLSTAKQSRELQMTSGYAPVNGLNLYYEMLGTGAPLVLIHGGGSTIETTFGRVMTKFAQTRKVIAVEMQAHGRTADINRPLSFETDADDVAALLNYLNINKADVFGFSNGANTTLQMAIRHPELVNKIVVASTFYKRDGAPSWFWEMMANPSFETMPQPFKEAFLKVNPDTQALHRMYERDVARMQSFPDIPEAQMKAIKAPAMILLGDRDVVTLKHAVEMQKLLNNSRLFVVPGGHGDYLGEITTPYDSTVIATTIFMVNRFLNEPPEDQQHIK